jgi:hypothetical protein
LFLSDDEKLILIKDYLSGKESKASAYFRYTGCPEDHGKIAVWMKKLGIKKIEDVRDVSFVPMSKAKKRFNRKLVLKSCNWRNEQLSLKNG